LGGKKDDYKTKQAHVELAARGEEARSRICAANGGSCSVCDHHRDLKGAANFEKAEDPIYVLENNLPIDCKWYLSNQLSKPLTRIFEPIIENVEKSLVTRGCIRDKIFIPDTYCAQGQSHDVCCEEGYVPWL
jgi:DNA polymerase delta subunit 1